ncbi:MAG: PEP-CTERM sorting domain-containing protein [Deltaproteobacteria bacterium]|nr:PEP-CTERM sorting domain-containing protein [Deltaproteobacteria bacterium]
MRLQRIFFARWFAVGFVIAAIFGALPCPGHAATIDSFQANQISWFGLSTPDWGEISFNLSSASASAQYLNIIDPGVSGDAGWMVQNFPVLPGLDTDHRYATTFNLADSPLGSGIEYQLTDAFLDTAPAAGTGTAVDIGTIGTVSYNANDINGRGGDGITDAGSVAAPLANGSRTFNLYSSLGEVSLHSGVPDQAQGKNECAPTSAANSFEWLNKEYDLELPDSQDTASEILGILKDSTHMGTSATSGTGDSSMIQGKLQFIDDHGLPLTVEFQDDSLGDQTHSGLTATSEGTKPTFDFIMEQLQKGQDIELGMTWWDEKNKKWSGGHWVTVVGAVEFGGQQGIFYNDPDDGSTQTKFSFLDASDKSGFSGFLRLEGETYNAVDIVVAESPSVPEPGTLGLVGSGLGVLLMAGRRRRGVKARRLEGGEVGKLGRGTY